MRLILTILVLAAAIHGVHGVLSANGNLPIPPSGITNPGVPA